MTPEEGEAWRALVERLEPFEKLWLRLQELYPEIAQYIEQEAKHDDRSR